MLSNKEEQEIINYFKCFVGDNAKSKIEDGYEYMLSVSTDDKCIGLLYNEGNFIITVIKGSTPTVFFKIQKNLLENIKKINFAPYLVSDKTNY